jgi:hypothetical protein
LGVRTYKIIGLGKNFLCWIPSQAFDFSSHFSVEEFQWEMGIQTPYYSKAGDMKKAGRVPAFLSLYLGKEFRSIA